MLVQVAPSILRRSSLMIPLLHRFWRQFAILLCMEHTSFSMLECQRPW